MQRFTASSLRRAYSSSVRSMAAAETGSGATALTINFVTPHQPVYKKKQVNSVTIPGANGEYGITFGHSAIISQLQPGVVSITHLNGDIEKFFVPGGFAITQTDSSTDISSPEAVPLADIDEALVRNSYAAAVLAVSKAADNSIAKATAQIEMETFTAIGRAIGVSL